MSDEPGPTRLGRYRLVRKLGRGGMATVFAAVQEGPHGFENEVAIKLVHAHLIHEHPHVVRMVVDEARVASRIKHPNVVRIMDLCEEPPDVLYVVMDYVDGVSMRQVLDTARALRTPPPLAPVLEVLAAACDGLHAAHQATQPDGTPLNLVHRDVKPGNILVSAEGDVKVSDFGIAFFGDRLVEATGHGQMKGTPAYMSPEQVLGTPVDARSDIFSMGLTLYTLATARLAFAGESPMGMAMKIAQESLEPHAEELDGICLGLGDILRTACAKEPMARYPQAAAMGAAMREVREGLRARATVAEMVVASGWKPRRPEERPGEMSSIDAKGTVVDVGPIARGTPVPPTESQARSTTAPFDDEETTGGLSAPPPQPAPPPSATTADGPGPIQPELLPPDPYARPVAPAGRPRIQPEITGSRPRVFQNPPPRPPPRGPGARPPGPPPPPRGAPFAPPRPPPPPGAPHRPARVLERDYRGRVIRPKEPEEESRLAGVLEKVGVAVVFALILVAVAVIVRRDVGDSEEDAEVVAEAPAQEDPFVAAGRATPAEPVAAPSSPTPEADPVDAPTPDRTPEPVVDMPPDPPPTPAAEPKPRSAPTPKPAQPAPTPAPTPAAGGSGLLSVNSYPWAEVHLDGKHVGRTPLLEHGVDAGPHTVRLVFSVAGPGGEVPEPVEKKVVVDDGEHEKVAHRAGQ